MAIKKKTRTAKNTSGRIIKSHLIKNKHKGSRKKHKGTRKKHKGTRKMRGGMEHTGLLNWINIRNLNWSQLSKNPGAIDLLKAYPDNINWNHLSKNPEKKEANDHHPTLSDDCLFFKEQGQKRAEMIPTLTVTSNEFEPIYDTTPNQTPIKDSQ